ncbi:MAG TPA: phosphoenolpyruvate hydrolase family protein, partial [Spirochaetia bacterium]|nr:phosphoenolpyruvate hydrolase family protein [Spirochaetia bacterium]
MAIARAEILKKLHDQAKAGIPIVGGGAGTGLSAKCEEAGGIDLIVLYNTGRYRMAGRVSITGLFAYGDANQIVLEMAGEVLPVVTRTPVLAGVNATDPFRLMPVFLKQVKEYGFSGVQNFPTVGLFDGRMRENMEATGLGYDKEVQMIRLAREMDLLTTPYVFNENEAREMAKAGADLVVAHVGLTTGGTIGAAAAMTMDQAVDTTLRIAAAAREVRKDILVICHGGPFDEPENV